MKRDPYPYLLGGSRRATHLVDLLPARAAESTCLRCRRVYWSTKYMPICLRPSCSVLARALAGGAP